MAEPNYYIDLFTPETWEEARARDFTITGFNERRQKYATRIQPGDVFLCYLTGRSRFVGALRVTSEVYADHEDRIWKSQPFPTRFRSELIVEVPADRGIHLREVQARSAQPDTYNWIFRASPQEMPADDSAWILERLQDISRTAPPVEHQVPIEVGESHEPTAQPEEQPEPEAKPERAHLRIQWKLATLGRQMSLRVWIARNDKNAVYQDQRLGDLSVDELPFTYDSTTQGTIERIDVLWLKRNRIEAAFEIESTTAIYSGLLRMGDLLALQPNIDIPLFIVAPDDRRHLVLREIRRPTFTRMETPLHEICRYLSFSKLEAALDRYGDDVKYLRPDFVDSIAERVV
jgi:EVE domain